MGACGVGQCLSGESDKGGWSWEGKRVLVLKWLLLMEGKEGQKKEAGLSTVLGGRFHKQGNLCMRLVFGE